MSQARRLGGGPRSGARCVMGLGSLTFGSATGGTGAPLAGAAAGFGVAAGGVAGVAGVAGAGAVVDLKVIFF
jgi:hypothetical protein